MKSSFSFPLINWLDLPVDYPPVDGGRKGGGLHHICFRTDNIMVDVEMLKAKGYIFLSDEPGEGAHNSKVIFIHPKSCDGVLIELNQPCESH